MTDLVRQIAITVGASEPAEIEILSVTLVPMAAVYAGVPVGIRSVSSTTHEDFGPQRRTLFAHAPSRISFPLRVPPAGRLELALGSLGAETQLAVRVDHGDSSRVVLEEKVPPRGPWRQRSIDLGEWAGRDVELSLVAEADEPAIAFWASPTVSSAPGATKAAEHPNVVFYVIDGASAGYMSVYGYDRATTPNWSGWPRKGWCSRTPTATPPERCRRPSRS